MTFNLQPSTFNHQAEPASFRYERKFVAEAFTTAEVLARVRRHPGGFREVYPPRVVNNIYLDSPSRRDYHDHINGTANRIKTRVRWYGPNFENAPRPVLERKLKRGMVSAKSGHALPNFAINGTCLRSLLTTHFATAELPSVLRLALQHMEPTLLNRYRRHYFLSRDGRFRLTVDSELQFAGVRPDGRHTAFQPAGSQPVIIELKFAPQFDACHVTNSFPFRVRRFSKYIAGIQAV